MRRHSLNEGQQQVHDALTGGLMPGFSILDAPAGTGKTFLIRHVYKSFKRGTCQILCPTHKARGLLEDVKAMTIHRFFGSEIAYDELNGDKVFDFKLPSMSMSKLKLIIVDESSMVSTSMLKIFQRIAEHVHVLFTCDRAQLPPVGEDMSPIYSIEHRAFTLDQNMRSANSAYGSHVTNFRHNVFITDPSKRIRAPVQLLTVSDDAMLEYFRTDQDAVIVCWTNKRKNDWNQLVRRNKFKVDAGEELHRAYEGEVFVYSGFRPEIARIYYSSDLVEMVSCTPVVHRLEYEPNSCGCQMSPKLQYKVRGCKRCGIQGHFEKGFDISFIKMEDTDGTEWNLPSTPEDDAKVKKLLDHRKKHILSLPPARRKSQWVTYYAFREKYFPDIDYSYAMTTHKAQGSQWKTVFMDFENLSWADTKDRLIYTAASRMQENLFIVKAS
jgi:hypothetical protein